MFRPWLFALVLGLAGALSPTTALLSIARGDEPRPARDRLDLLGLRSPAGTNGRIERTDQWAARREQILASMIEVMGPVPESAGPVPLEPEVFEETRLERFTRRKLRFSVEAGDRLSAWLLVPHALAGRVPAVLCLHQTTRIGKDEPAGLGGLANLHYARELAERGLVTLAVDYPNFGEYVCDPYERGYQSASMKGIWNHRRALDLLESLPEVDPQRLGVIGHSLGGHNSLFLAAMDTRVRAAVSCCGFCQFRHYYRGDLTGWSHRGYMPRIESAYHRDPAQMPFDFSEVLAAIAPRACLVVAPRDDENFAVAGVVEAVTAAEPVFRLLGAGDRLRAIYPDGGHDFPPAARTEAYQWLEAQLAPATAKPDATDGGR